MPADVTSRGDAPAPGGYPLERSGPDANHHRRLLLGVGVVLVVLVVMAIAVAAVLRHRTRQVWLDPVSESAFVPVAGELSGPSPPSCLVSGAEVSHGNDRLDLADGSSVQVEGAEVGLGSAQGSVRLVEANGDVRWAVDLTSEAADCVVLAGAVAIVGTHYWVEDPWGFLDSKGYSYLPRGRFLGIDVENGHVRWKVEVLGRKRGDATAFTDGAHLVITFDGAFPGVLEETDPCGEIHAVDPRDGDRLWASNLCAPGTFAPPGQDELWPGAGDRPVAVDGVRFDGSRVTVQVHAGDPFTADAAGDMTIGTFDLATGAAA